jgi:hypothetical protein
MFFCDWNNYVLGRPLATDYDVTSIMFWLPEALARRKIRRRHMLIWRDEADETVIAEMAATKDPTQRQEIWQSHRRYVYEYGRQFFTWEKAFLCPVCLHWWLSLIFLGVMWAFGYTFDHGIALLLYLMTHYLIKKI